MWQLSIFGNFWGTIVLNNYADFIGEQAFQKKNPLFRLRGPMGLGSLT